MKTAPVTLNGQRGTVRLHRHLGTPTAQGREVSVKFLATRLNIPEEKARELLTPS